jgi:hypothetical protein
MEDRNYIVAYRLRRCCKRLHRHAVASDSICTGLTMCARAGTAQAVAAIIQIHGITARMPALTRRKPPEQREQKITLGKCAHRAFAVS